MSRQVIMPFNTQDLAVLKDGILCAIAMRQESINFYKEYASKSPLLPKMEEELQERKVMLIRISNAQRKVEHHHVA